MGGDRRHVDFARIPPGDRAPLARSIAARHLEALAALTAANAPAHRLARHRTHLGRLARTAARLGFDLPPAVAALGSPLRKRKISMTSTAAHDLPIWSEDLTEQPHHARIRDLLREMVVSEGIPAGEVLDAVRANASALSLQTLGLVETSLSFYRAGAALAHACPEIQEIAAESLRLANALGDRVDEKAHERRAGRPRTDH